jgi:hypothetical protein
VVLSAGLGATARTVPYRPLNERQTSVKAGESFAGRALAQEGEGCKVTANLLNRDSPYLMFEVDILYVF